MISSEQFDAERILPLLRNVINNVPDETIITEAYAAVGIVLGQQFRSKIAVLNHTY